MPDETVAGTGRPRALEAILIGGLIAGVLDGLDAVIYYKWAIGLAPARLFQGIASGLLGARSFHGGWATVFLGVILHFTIATGAAAVFYFACRVLPSLFRKPWVFGPTYGLLVYLVMHYVVVPLSAVARRKVPMHGAELVDQLFSHMFLLDFRSH